MHHSEEIILAVRALIVLHDWYKHGLTVPETHIHIPKYSWAWSTVDVYTPACQ